MPKENTPLIQCFDQYITECEFAKKLRPATIKGYKEVFSCFLKNTPELDCVSDLSAQVITHFYRQIQESKRKGKQGVKGSTLRTYYNKLITFFRWLERNQYIQEGSLTKSVIKPPTPTYEDERALSSNDVSKILSAVSLHSADNEFILSRDISMLYTLLYTGIRKGELLGLRVHDIDFLNHQVFVNGQTSKSKKSRKIPLHPILAIYLRSYMKVRKKYASEHLFLSSTRDSALTEHGLKHWVERYKKWSGVAFHIHRFRHTFACTLAKQNADIISIKNVMGHASVRMTERYLRSIKTENARSFIYEMSF